MNILAGYWNELREGSANTLRMENEKLVEGQSVKYCRLTNFPWFPSFCNNLTWCARRMKRKIVSVVVILFISSQSMPPVCMFLILCHTHFSYFITFAKFLFHLFAIYWFTLIKTVSDVFKFAFLIFMQVSVQSVSKEKINLCINMKYNWLLNWLPQSGPLSLSIAPRTQLLIMRQRQMVATSIIRNCLHIAMDRALDF